jgi:hypothetical protein
MAKKLVPPETWQGIPVEPYGEYQFRYWISKEDTIGVVLNARRGGTYEVEYRANNKQFILSDEQGYGLYVKTQSDFVRLMGQARTKIIEHYDQLVREAEALAEEALADAVTRRELLHIAANGAPKKEKTFWDRLE